MKDYLWTVITTALACGILMALVPGKKEIWKLICGGILAITILSPLKQVDISRYMQLPERFWEEGETFSAQGQAAAGDGIKARLEAYILAEAAKLGAELEVDLTLGENFLPQTISLRGEAPPGTRETLEQWLTRELGIAKEKIQWIG